MLRQKYFFCTELAAEFAKYHRQERLQMKGDIPSHAAIHFANVRGEFKLHLLRAAHLL